MFNIRENNIYDDILNSKPNTSLFSMDEAKHELLK